MSRTDRIRRRRTELASEEGFTLIAVLGVMLALMALTVTAFAAAGGDIRLGRYDQDQKRAYAAAEAGIQRYLYQLNEDNGYWARCTNVPPPMKVNQAWNGVGPDPRQRVNIPGSTEQYAVELIPANGRPSCNPADATDTMIDSSTGTFRIRSTGFANNAKRSIVATMRRRGFLDFLYFTDYETADSTWYDVDTGGRPTSSTGAPSFNGETLSAWGSRTCNQTYWRNGRGGLSYNGWLQTATTPAPNGTWSRFNDTCTEIQFAPGDVIAGPLHTNDDILVCGRPTFGRTPTDRIEASGNGWRGSGSCSGNSPNFVGTWVPNSPVLTLPPSNGSLKDEVDPGYTFTGNTTIVLNGSSMTVNGSPMPLPPNGVVYVKNGTCGSGYKPLNPYNDPPGCGNVNISGTYSESLTIAAEKDIIIRGDVNRSGDVLLGLIANEFIRIYHPVTRDPNDPTKCNNAPGTMNNVEVDAAILSLNHSFTVDNYYCGAPLGTLTVNGTIGQKFRGPVGRGGGSGKVNGYTKDYNYDDRLRFRAPPHFLDPVQAAWRIQRYTEQVPAR